MFFDPVACGGAVLALIVAVVALRASRRSPGFYEGQVYDLDARFHRRVFFAAAAAVLIFGAGTALVRLPSTILAGALALAAILYLSSFARGADDQDPPP